MRPSETQHTPLYESHLEAGARMVDFAGWEMPVQYSGVMEEHRAVRTAAGLFDVSHMGEISVRGTGAEAFLQKLTPNDVSKLTPGRAHYSGLLNENAGYLDDLLIYRLDPDDFLVVVNAANTDKDFDWILRHAADVGDDGDLEVENVSSQWALLALQGPKALEILEPLVPEDLELDEVRYYGFVHGTVDGVSALLSRTGYTGEDGFELYLPPHAAPRVWSRLLEEGKDLGLVPAGLGARDTLRLEAGMALYGHELNEKTTPYEAGLGWVVKLDSGDFVGRDVLAKQKEAGVDRKLVGFEVEGRGIAREGHGVRVDGEAVGEVTSGTYSPTFEKALGMAYVATEAAEPGTEISLHVRGRDIDGRVASLPFYRRSK